MELRYNFSEEEFLKLCLYKLKRENTTVFEDIYETLKHFLNTPESVLITDIKHRFYPEYYDDNLSLKEYLDKGEILLPYIEFNVSSKKENDLKITGIQIPPFLKLNNINSNTPGYTIKNTELKTKNKSSIKLFSVEIPLNLLVNLYSKTAPAKDLLPSKLGVWEWRQTFYNKITGESFFCSCFKNALLKDGMDASESNHHLRYALKNHSFKASICHVCTNTNSDLMYCHKMYGSAFKIRYGAYIRKQAIQEDISEKDAENQIRELKGVAKIGERWINETLLFNYINLLFPEHIIQREASPNWLNKQRFDIYLPQINLAVEYQGQQHYIAVDLFGGQEGLEKTIQRDKEKLRLSKLNGVNIVYFNYKDNLTEKLVKSRLKSYIK